MDEFSAELCRFQRLLPFGAKTLCHATVTLSLPNAQASVLLIAICTSLPRQLLRPENAWYFYTDISAGSRENFGGKREERLTAGYVVFENIVSGP